MDAREEVCGIVICGTPAPGINGVISAVVLQCLALNIVPIGFLYGFKYLSLGKTSHVQYLQQSDVTRDNNRGGSILYISKVQLRTKKEIHNCIHALQILHINYLITVGGGETAFSAHKLAQEIRDIQLRSRQRDIMHNATKNSPVFSSIDTDDSNTDYYTNDIHLMHNILITHVPKTIFNDLPLPPNCYTFGFSTAREIGTRICSNLSADARTMDRWYITTIIGSLSGHLGLGIATASAATICLVPEEFHRSRTKSSYLKHAQQMEQIEKIEDTLFENKESVIDYKNNNVFENEVEEGVRFKEIIDILDACMIKRAACGITYGVVVISEGIVDTLCVADQEKYFKSDLDRAHETLALVIKDELVQRWSARKSNSLTFRTKFIGFELRSCDPNSHDMILSRELGYSAVWTCKMKKVNATMVTMKGGELVSIPLSQMVDPINNKMRVKMLDINSLSWRVAQSYMIKLCKHDLRDEKLVSKMAGIAGMSVEIFRETYAYIAVNSGGS